MTRFEIFRAWLVYRQSELRKKWLTITGRCWYCGRRGGYHKFSCYNPDK